MKKIILLLTSLYIISLTYAQSGRVGIGESSPGSKGSIKGNLSVGENYSSQQAPANGAIIEGKTAVGTANPDASAKLQIDATDAGILVPRMNSTQRSAISTPATGLMVYDTDLKVFYYFDGSVWKNVGGSGPIGPTGPKGDTGNTGAQGIQGVKGDTGAQGIQGVKGNTGSQGIQGVQGPKGDTGAKGDKGDQGIQGVAGAQGPAGAVGAQGPKGDTGAKGDKGDQGIQGVKGNTGNTGVQGSQGAQGPKGDTGAKGDKGDQGIQGVKGNTGNTGAQGIQGPAGPVGCTNANYVLKNNGTTATCSQIFDNGTNVGIGNNNPQTKLHVSGTAQLNNTVWGWNSLGVYPGSDTYYKIATLPISSSSTYDHIVIEGVLDEGWGSSQKAPFRITLGNRNGFSFFYDLYGNLKSGVRIVAYKEADNSISVYLYHAASRYTTISYNIVNSLQATVYPNPTLSNTTPTGTIAFDSYTSTPRFAIDNSGNVAIGTTTNSSYKLLVNGKLKTTGINETSDIRLKKDITPITEALQKVLQMDGVTYNWRLNEYPDKGLDKGKQYGLIAQELEKIIPELVSTDSEGWKSIEYSHLVPVLIEALKEQQAIIERQENTQKEQQAIIEQQNTSIQKLSASTDNRIIQLEKQLQQLNEILGVKTQK